MAVPEAAGEHKAVVSSLAFTLVAERRRGV